MRRSADFLRCLSAMLIWLLLSIVAGLFATFYGPGGAGLILGLFSGVCGMSLHLLLWAYERKPHWSYAGFIFGFVTTFVLWFFNRGSSFDLLVLFIIFLAVSVLSAVVYPIASLVLKNHSKERA